MKVYASHLDLEHCAGAIHSLRLVYVDETGHSAKEPVAIVAGIVLNPDQQLALLTEHIEDIKQRMVPEEFRDKFIFHATELQHGGRYRQRWSDEDRWATLEQLIALPRQIDVPIVVGFGKNIRTIDPSHKHNSKVAHTMAYAFCMQAVDWFMQNHTAPEEVAMVVAEQREEARRAIEGVHRVLRDPEMCQKWFSGIVGFEFPFLRIRGQPAFAEKKDEPLLQIADACAFVFQRHLKTAFMSDRLLSAMFGDFAQPAVLGKFREQAGNFACFWWGSRESPGLGILEA